jgi:nucleoid-associated protein EbfC
MTNGTPELDTMMEQLRQQQQEVERIQRGVEVMVVKGYSRANEVIASVRGSGQFVDIAIDPAVLRSHDAHDVGAIVTEAVNDALNKMSAATKARFAPVLDRATPPSIVA